MRILGLDPGTRYAGFGVILCKGQDLKLLDYGVLDLHESRPLPERLLNLQNSLQEIFRAHQPHVTVIEKVFVGRNIQSALHLGHARGICLVKAAEYNSSVVEYATREVKKGISGRGSADKFAVRQNLQLLLGRSLSEEFDATDALALSVHHGQQLWIAERMDQAANLREGLRR